MSIMSNEVVFEAGVSVFTHRNSRTRIIRNLRRLDDRFITAGDLDTGILHTTHAHARNPEIGVCHANAHSPWTREIKTCETCVVNVLSQNCYLGGKNSGAVKRRAHHRNAAPQMHVFVILAGSYFDGVSRPRPV